LVWVASQIRARIHGRGAPRAHLGSGWPGAVAR
jgi:hypothetical protein